MVFVTLLLFDNIWTFKTQNTEYNYIHFESYIYKKLKEAVEIYKDQRKKPQRLSENTQRLYMYS